MKVKKSTVKKINKTKPNKIKSRWLTYTWTPPTKEEIAIQAKSDFENKLRNLKELGIFLEGMKKSDINTIYPLDHSHLSALWWAIEKIKSSKQ